MTTRKATQTKHAAARPVPPPAAPVAPAETTDGPPAGEVTIPIRMRADVVKRYDAAADALCAAVPGSSASRTSLMRAVLAGHTTLAEIEARTRKAEDK